MMKTHFHGKGLAQHTLCILCLSVVILVLADSPNKGDDQTFQGAATGTITAAFSPNSGATKLVTDTIHQAKKQILVQAYSFTSPAIAKALADVKKRGADVKAILGKSQWMEEGNGLKSNPVGNRYNPKWERLEHVDEAQGCAMA